MNALSRQKRAIFFYSSFILWVGTTVGLFFYLIFNFWLLKSQVSHLMVIPYIPLLGALYFSLDFIKRRKLLFFVFLLAFFATNALPIFGIIRAAMGLIERNRAAGLDIAYFIVVNNIYQILLIIGFFIYERLAKNAQRITKILIPLGITFILYFLIPFSFWIEIITTF